VWREIGKQRERGETERMHEEKRWRKRETALTTHGRNDSQMTLAIDDDMSVVPQQTKIPQTLAAHGLYLHEQRTS
jgi:hypothetical protein